MASALTARSTPDSARAPRATDISSDPLEQRHEAHEIQALAQELGAGATDAEQLLLTGATDGNHEAAAIGELFQQSRRHVRRRRAHEDSVVGRLAAPAKPSV